MPNGKLAFFDFGMVGRISPQLQAKMIDAFFHVVAKDAQGIAQDLIDLDFLKPGADETKIKEIVVKMFDLHLNLKLKDVKFKELTYDLADVMYDYPFRLPSNVAYIMRALMTLEGIGISLIRNSISLKPPNLLPKNLCCAVKEKTCVNWLWINSWVVIPKKGNLI